ncbi:MAG: hypothetical protein ACYTHM_24640, partial [Planctomycetota bacterium]
EKAKPHADETGVAALDTKISNARFQIEQANILPQARDLKSRGDFQGVLDLLERVPDHSPIYAAAQKLMKDSRYEISIRKARDYYRQGDAENAMRILSEKEFFADPDFSTLREKVRKISDTMARGDKAYADAMKQIQEMEEPVQIQGFETARQYWTEVKNLEAADPTNVFVSQATRKLFELTNEKIGGFYFEKALALLDAKSLRKGRDFLDLARKYDLRLGLEKLKEWKQDAGRKYNQAINLIAEDKKKARALLKWIVDILRPGDTHYYEKAQRALASIPDD